MPDPIKKVIAESTKVKRNKVNEKELKNIVSDMQELGSTGNIKKPRAEANKGEKFLPDEQTRQFFEKHRDNIGYNLYSNLLKIQRERGNPTVNVGANKGLPFSNPKNYNIFTNEINIPKKALPEEEIEGYLGEAAHSGQSIGKVIPQWLGNDLPAYFKEATARNPKERYDASPYRTKGTIENYTHKVVEEDLRNQFLSQGSTFDNVNKVEEPKKALGGYVQQDKLSPTLNNYLNSNMNKYNNGGMFTSYNVGGTHEQNPNGGVPIGDDALVEQGETSVNLNAEGAPTEKSTGSKYIFSDRQVWTPEEIKMAGLPPSRKPVTAGEYMAKLGDKFKDKAGSKADKETLDSFTKRATGLAEQKRIQQEQLEQAMQLNSQQIAPENTEVPEGMEEYAEQPQSFDTGGLQAATPSADAAGAGNNGAMTDAGSYVKASGTAFDLYNMASTGNTTTKTGNAMLGGAASGAMAGTSIMPGWGTLIGAVVGAGAGFFGAKKAQKNENAAQNRDILAVNSGMPNASAWTGMGGSPEQQSIAARGGYITSKPARYDDGGPVKPNTNDFYKEPKDILGVKEMTRPTIPLEYGNLSLPSTTGVIQSVGGKARRQPRSINPNQQINPYKEVDKNITDARNRTKEWYNNPETIRRWESLTGYSGNYLKPLTAHGLNVPMIKGTPDDGTQAQFSRYPNEQTVYENNPERGVLDHEITHQMGVDEILGPHAQKILGDPYKQKTKNAPNATKAYLSTGKEVYGNLHQFRTKLELKPGETIKDAKDLKNRVEKHGAKAENFYQTYDDDNIVKAINTIAQNKGKKKEPVYAKNGGLIKKYDDGGYGPDGEGTLTDSGITSELAKQFLSKAPDYLLKSNNPQMLNGEQQTQQGTMSNYDATNALASQYRSQPPAYLLKKNSPSLYTPEAQSSGNPLSAATPSAQASVPGQEGNGANKFGDATNSLMRAYPMISNIIERDKIRKPVGTYSAKLSDAYNVPQVDDTRAMRDINAAYNNRYRALGQIGGSQAQQRANMLGIGLQQNQAISQTQAGLEGIRMNRSMQEQDFKNKIAQYNASKHDYDQETYAKDIANYDTQRSKFTSQIANDIGSMGLENDRMDQVANMYGYDRKGNYMINRKTGKPATPEELAQIQQASSQKTPTLKPGDKYLNAEGKEVIVSAYGGFLKNRRYGK